MNNHMNELLKAGTLLRLEHGSYSDYGVDGFYVVLQDFLPEQQLEAYLKAHPEQREKYEFESNGLITHLIREGLLLEVAHKAWYLGSYRGISEIGIYDACFDYCEGLGT